MFIDPFSGRESPYRFVNLHTDEDVHRALTTLQGQDVRGRPASQIAHAQRGAQRQRDRGYVFERWARPDEAPSGWITPLHEGRRFYVCGLPRVDDQSHVNSMMR